MPKNERKTADILTRMTTFLIERRVLYAILALVYFGSVFFSGGEYREIATLIAVSIYVALAAGAYKK